MAHNSNNLSLVKPSNPKQILLKATAMWKPQIPQDYIIERCCRHGNMDIGCPKLASRQSNATRDTHIASCIPQALTTALEGLIKQEKREMQNLADDGMRKATR